MAMSRAERKIKEIFEMNDISFEQEYIFPELKSSNGKPLRFDFAIFDDEGGLDFLIEYQGKQHYEAVGKFGGAKGLYQQQYNDSKKRSFCKQNGLKLIEISFKEEPFINYTYIMEKAGY